MFCSNSSLRTNIEACLAGAVDGDDGYFSNVRLKVQDLAHAMRRQIPWFSFLAPRSSKMFWTSNDPMKMVSLQLEPLIVWQGWAASFLYR